MTKRLLMVLVISFCISGCFTSFVPRDKDIAQAEQNMLAQEVGTPEYEKAKQDYDSLIQSRERNGTIVDIVEKTGNGIVPFSGTLASLAFALYMASGKGKIKKALVSTIKVIAEKGSQELKQSLKEEHSENKVRDTIDDIRHEIKGA